VGLRYGARLWGRVICSAFEFGKIWGKICCQDMRRFGVQMGFRWGLVWAKMWGTVRGSGGSP